MDTPMSTHHVRLIMMMTTAIPQGAATADDRSQYRDLLETYVPHLSMNQLQKLMDALFEKRAWPERTSAGTTALARRAAADSEFTQALRSGVRSGEVPEAKRVFMLYLQPTESRLDCARALIHDSSCPCVLREAAARHLLALTAEPNDVTALISLTADSDELKKLVLRHCWHALVDRPGLLSDAARSWVLDPVNLRFALHRLDYAYVARLARAALAADDLRRLFGPLTRDENYSIREGSRLAVQGPMDPSAGTVPVV